MRLLNVFICTALALLCAAAYHVYPPVGIFVLAYFVLIGYGSRGDK